MADLTLPDALRELAGQELYGGNLRIYPPRPRIPRR